jgi:vacuolar protein sorting-associated protein 1
MECTMSSSANAWGCSISLRFEYDGRGLPLSSPRIHPFVPLLTNKNQFELSLRRAQAAILNPDIPHDAFLQKTAQELKDIPQSDSSLKFSKNIVRVDISDPEATDLSFADLPGMPYDLRLSLCADYYYFRVDS